MDEDMIAEANGQQRGLRKTTAQNAKTDKPD